MLANEKKYDYKSTGATLEPLDPASVELSDAVLEAAGMLSKGERQMLFQLSSQNYKGKGAIIDGGSFFGSSLVSTAAGLKNNPEFEAMNFNQFAAGKPIYSYELGFLPAPKNDKIDKKRVFGKTPYTLGDSFEGILKETITDYNDLIKLHIGDLLKESWTGEPIEICFIDVCKTAALNKHVSQEFYAHLIPNDSYLINQDFFFDRLPWIKVTMGYLDEYFTWCGQVSTSSVYKNIKKIPQEVADFDPFTECDLEECLKLHDKVPYQFLDRRYTYYMELSKAYLMALKNKKYDALEYLDAISKVYADLLDDESADRGNKFRLDRAVRQISNGNIHKVS